MKDCCALSVAARVFPHCVSDFAGDLDLFLFLSSSNCLFALLSFLLLLLNIPRAKPWGVPGLSLTYSWSQSTAGNVTKIALWTADDTSYAVLPHLQGNMGEYVYTDLQIIFKIPTWHPVKYASLPDYSRFSIKLSQSLLPNKGMHHILWCTHSITTHICNSWMCAHSHWNTRMTVWKHPTPTPDSLSTSASSQISALSWLFHFVSLHVLFLNLARKLPMAGDRFCVVMEPVPSPK